MYFRQIAVATALYAMLYAMFALAGATANMPTLDIGIDDWHKESGPAYSFEPDDIVLREEGIIP